jgi:nucleoside 2-deoxyribosyltransferase
MSRPVPTCVLCNHPLQDIQSQSGTALYSCKCEVCGQYYLEEFYESRFRSLPSEERAMLSAYTRELFEHNSQIPHLPNLEIAGQVEGIIESYKKKTVFDKLDNLILYIARRSHYFREALKTSKETDYPITYSYGPLEFAKIFNYAKEAGYIKFPEVGPGANTELDMKGWEKAEKLREARSQSKVCFIAMSFSPELDGVFNDGIVPAITEAGYSPNRVDLVEHNEKICDFIIKEIRASKFMVADMTFQRANVLFEAGFAHGLNRPVIWTCRNDTRIEEIFDTRQYNHIIWENAADLKKRLYNRIMATIL